MISVCKRSHCNPFAHIQGRRSVTGTCSTSFMQGGKRAPRLIKADSDGPNMGLTTGYLNTINQEQFKLQARGTDFQGDRCPLLSTIDNKFVNEDGNHNRCQEPD